MLPVVRGEEVFGDGAALLEDQVAVLEDGGFPQDGAGGFFEAGGGEARGLAIGADDGVWERELFEQPGDADGAGGLEVVERDGRHYGMLGGGGFNTSGGGGPVGADEV